MAFWNFLFGEDPILGRTFNGDAYLMRCLLKRRLKDIPEMENMNALLAMSIDETELYGMPEATIVTIVQSYILLKKQGLTDSKIFKRIEKHRSKAGRGWMPPNPTLLKYIKYRICLEHSQGANLTDKFITWAVKESCERYEHGDDSRSNESTTETYKQNGETTHSAILIQAKTTMAGIREEYSYLQKKFGQEDIDWSTIRQGVQEGDGRHFDVFEIRLKTGEPRTIYFDITNFFGKW